MELERDMTSEQNGDNITCLFVNLFVILLLYHCILQLEVRRPVPLRGTSGCFFYC